MTVHDRTRLIDRSTLFSNDARVARSETQDGFAFRDSWLAPRNAFSSWSRSLSNHAKTSDLPCLQPGRLAQINPSVSTMTNMCCAFPIGLMALGCGVGLPDRQSCRWPVSELGL